MEMAYTSRAFRMSACYILHQFLFQLVDTSTDDLVITSTVLLFAVSSVDCSADIVNCHAECRTYGLIIDTSMSIIAYSKGKGSFYIAQYPVRWTAQSASDTVLGFSGKHSSQAAITRQD